MNAEEFLYQWTKNSGITLTQLEEFGLGVFPCDCEEEGCQGWQMRNKNDFYADWAMGVEKLDRVIGGQDAI